MEKLIQMINQLIKQLEAQSLKVESVHWYLLNNLQRFKDVAENSPSLHAIENEGRALSRFCIDSMDWEDELFKATTAITEQARHAIHA
ncbi:MAG: hypothetical protein C0429_17440 [Sphingopyxis sp.]|jgi:hypothetical protein|nr:hypothetical protein [Sphingopyxis sp.]